MAFHARFYIITNSKAFRCVASLKMRYKATRETKENCLKKERKIKTKYLKSQDQTWSLGIVNEEGKKNAV